jgi:hypothetical protein
LRFTLRYHKTIHYKAAAACGVMALFSMKYLKKFLTLKTAAVSYCIILGIFVFIDAIYLFGQLFFDATPSLSSVGYQIIFIDIIFLAISVLFLKQFKSTLIGLLGLVTFVFWLYLMSLYGYPAWEWIFAITFYCPILLVSISWLRSYLVRSKP